MEATRRKYEQPQQEVVELTITNALLQGSGQGGGSILPGEVVSPGNFGFEPDDND